jgi:hypothetical protein
LYGAWGHSHDCSLYLGHYSKHLEKNYNTLVQEKGGTNGEEWGDIILMVRALEPGRCAATMAGHTKYFEGRSRQLAREFHHATGHSCKATSELTNVLPEHLSI